VSAVIVLLIPANIANHLLPCCRAALQARVRMLSQPGRIDAIFIEFLLALMAVPPAIGFAWLSLSAIRVSAGQYTLRSTSAIMVPTSIWSALPRYRRRPACGTRSSASVAVCPIAGTGTKEGVARRRQRLRRAIVFSRWRSRCRCWSPPGSASSAQRS
jgi:hypothetical protein